MKRLLFIVLLCVGEAAHAQTDFDRYISIAWDINLPVSNTNYVSDVSTRGFRFGYREHISDNFFLGADLQNATLTSHVPRQTYTTDNGALTTDYFNYVYSYSIALGGDYYFTPSKKLSPFVSLGMGANYASFKRYFNIYTNSDSNWGFLIRPEAGAILKMGKQEAWGIIGSVRLDYSTVKSDMAGYNGISTIGFRIGIVALDWR